MIFIFYKNKSKTLRILLKFDNTSNSTRCCNQFVKYSLIRDNRTIKKQFKKKPGKSGQHSVLRVWQNLNWNLTEEIVLPVTEFIISAFYNSEIIYCPPLEPDCFRYQNPLIKLSLYFDDFNMASCKVSSQRSQNCLTITGSIKIESTKPAGQ